MNTLSVKNEMQYYRQLRERLVADVPEADDETIRDTLEGITNLHEMIAAIIRSALVDEALQAGLRIAPRRNASAARQDRGARAEEATASARGHE